MPYEPPPSDSPVKLVYPLEHMRETAAKIATQASLAQQQHDTTMQTLRSYYYNTDNCDPQVAELIFGVLLPYADRLRAGYDWQMNLATAIFTVVDAIEENEGQIAQSFRPAHGPF